jgi:hypothetical protein
MRSISESQATTLKITALWGVIQCSLVDKYQSFYGALCFDIQGC